jgi:hypothetical protein
MKPLIGNNIQSHNGSFDTKLWSGFSCGEFIADQIVIPAPDNNNDEAGN